MYDKIIETYVNKLTLNDIIFFAKKENFSLPKNDAEVILFYIKNYWQIIYKKNPTFLFEEFKEKVSESTYQKVIELYNKYKTKIN